MSYQGFHRKVAEVSKKSQLWYENIYAGGFTITVTHFRIFGHRNVMFGDDQNEAVHSVVLLCYLVMRAVRRTFLQWGSQPDSSSWPLSAAEILCLSRCSASSDFLPACVLWDKSRWGNAVVKRESWRAMARLPPKRPRPVTRRAAQPLKWVMISYYLQHQTWRFVCFTGMVSFVKVLKCPPEQQTK